MNLVVIDSEGIGALDESAEHDARIFSLTVLLSSYFIYNSVGSIDENALQNLNLVVSITKNIHLRSKGNDDVEAEEYSQYFPSFLWVVRDFALQLVDSEGDEFTSKQYLERALETQKGLSDQVEGKNRIRKMIQSFFREKDCYTMIRPLVDETNLQNLDKMEMDQLRPDFVDQVMELRKKIMTKAKVKTLNGRPLSGFMLVSLLQSYVNSINEGAVPNIENAWTYICKNQCNNAMQSSLNEYDEMMNDAMTQSWPMAPENLINVHRDCREQAIRSYKHSAVGEFREAALEELESRLADRLSSIEQDNKRDFETILAKSLDNGYSRIEKKLKNSEYKDFMEYERDVRALQVSYLDNDMGGLNRDGLVAEYLLRKLSEAVHLFFNAIRHDSEATVAELERQRQALEKDITTIKEESMKDKNKLNSKLSDAEYAKQELTVKLQCVSEELTALKDSKLASEKQLQADLQAELDVKKDTIVQLSSQIEGLKKEAQAQDKKLVLLSSDFEKEKALMVQKLSFYEMTDKSLQEKEKDLHEEIARAQEEADMKIKSLTQKHRETVDKLEADLKAISQRYSDVLDDNKELEMEKRNLQEALTDRDAKHKAKINSLIQQLDDLENDKISSSKIVRTEGEQAVEEELKSKLASSILKITQLESEIRTKDDDSKLKRSKLEKEKAILQQSIEFLETQLSDLRGQIEENKRIHETSMRAFEGSTSTSKVDISKELELIKESHKREIRQLEGELMNTRKRLNDELLEAIGQRDELDKQLQATKTELEGEISSLTEKLSNLTTERDRWLGDSKTAEEAKLRLVKEIEDRCRLRQVDLEQEIEELKERNMQEIAEIAQKREEDFKKVKHFFEEERERLETKILEDKEKYEKKLTNMIEEYEQKSAKDHQDFEEQIEDLQEDLKEAEIQNMALRQHSEQELIMRQQEYEQVVKQYKDVKEQLRMLQMNSNSNLEQAMKEYSEERKILNTKLDQAKSDLAQKEKEIYGYKQTSDSFKADLERLKERTEEKISTLNTENEKLTAKAKEMTELYQKLNEEHMQNKIDYGKNAALSQQQNEFFARRIEELQKQVDESNKRTEEKLRAQREAHQSEVDKLISQYREEKSAMEDKYEAKRKSIKEMEGKYQKRISEMDKEKSILSEKLNAIEGELAKSEKKHANEIESLNAQVSSLKETLSQEKKLLKTENESLNKKLYQLELEHTELSSSYDKDKALWEGRFSFLTQQKDQFKEDAAEAQKHLEVIVQKWQTTRSSDKEEVAYNQTALMSQIEQRYTSQINEINESHKNIISDFQDRIARLEKENKNMSERLHSEGSNRNHSTIKTLEAKISDLMQREATLSDQLMSLKNEKDELIIDFKQKLDKDRENWKKKCNDLETKFKESESKRTKQLLDAEKDKAKWTIEKEHLNVKVSEQIEQIYKLEKKQDVMVRENEKLKTEAKKSKRLGANSNFPNFYTGNALGNLNSSKFGEKSFNRDK